MKRTELIKQLKKQGFKMPKVCSTILVNSTGKVYNLKTGRYLKPNQNNVINHKGKLYNVYKLILDAFKGEPYRSGQITHKDNNKSNTSLENIIYSRIFKPDIKIEIDPTDLKNMIRCYFEVKTDYSVYDNIETRIYLKMIIEKRNFYKSIAPDKNIEIFKIYIDGFDSKNTIAKKNGLTTRDCAIIINQFINLLIEQTKKDNLQILPFAEPKPTKTELIKKYNKELIKQGKKKIPLRKKSNKELLNEFRKVNLE